MSPPAPPPPSIETLLRAIALSDVDAARHILGCGIDPNVLSTGNCSNTPVVVKAVICARDTDMFDLLESYGADVDAPRTDNGFTPLIQAINNNHYDKAAWLLAHGADIEKCDKSGLSPLDHAAKKPDDEFTQLVRGAIRAREEAVRVAAEAAAAAEREKQQRADIAARQAALRARAPKLRFG